METEKESPTAEKSVGNTEQTYKRVADYKKYLMDKFSHFAKNSYIEGVPSTVEISDAFLKKCLKDPEKKEYLETNFAAMSDISTLKNGLLGTLTSVGFQMDGDGNISMTCSTTNDPDGSIARENAKRKAQENKKNEEKLEEKKNKKLNFGQINTSAFHEVNVEMNLGVNFNSYK